MYTGVDPVVHGIMTYTRPQLTCDTLYDQLIAAGKNILCEKSFTVNAMQAQEIYELAKKKGVFVMAMSLS